MIFLDPGYCDECTIWFDDGNVQTLRGSIINNCIKIRNYVIDQYDDEFGNIIRRVQVKKVYLDCIGVGTAYANCLRDMDVKFEKCTYNKRIS